MRPSMKRARRLPKKCWMPKLQKKLQLKKKTLRMRPSMKRARRLPKKCWMPKLQKKIATEKELAELKAKIHDTEEYKGQKEGDLGAEKDLKSSLMSDCSR